MQIFLSLCRLLKLKEKKLKMGVMKIITNYILHNYINIILLLMITFILYLYYISSMLIMTMYYFYKLLQHS